MAEGLRRAAARFGPWIAGAVLLAIYLNLPEGDGDRVAEEQELATQSSEKLEVLSVRPLDPNPRSAVVIRYSGPGQVIGADFGKLPMEIIERPPGALVARVPEGAAPGYHKIRVLSQDDRSKPFRVRVDPIDWRKRFRNLVGGLALVLFGLELLSRALREATGLDSAVKLARIAVRRDASYFFGGLLGGLVQSTSSVAGVLGALVATNLLGVTAAAAAFLGAALASGAAPFLLTSVVAPSEGLIAVALGVVWVRLARDRRTKAFGRLLLGAGVMAFGLHVLRPGFEPLLSEPLLLTLVDGFHGHGFLSTMSCVVLGVLLAALLQGPAPVLLLVVSLAETTGLWNLQSAVAVIAGSGLGSALGAMLALPRAAQARGFGLLNLTVGALSTLIAAAGVPVWCAISDWIVSGTPHEMAWGQRVLLPKIGLHLAVAFGLSQLAAALVLLPALPMLSRRFERMLRRSPLPAERSEESPILIERLAGVLRAERRALTPIAELARSGSRSLSSEAERELARARAALDELLSVPRGAEPVADLGPALLNCLQLQSAIEMLLRQTDRLVETRLTASSPVLPLPHDEENALSEMQKLLADGLDDLATSLESRIPLDSEHNRAREIRMNAVEAGLRGALSLERLQVAARPIELGVLEWVGTCEIAGNHVYRLGQSLAELFAAGLPLSVRSESSVRPEPV
jgi:hypothetical protein